MNFFSRRGLARFAILITVVGCPLVSGCQAPAPRPAAQPHRPVPRVDHVTRVQIVLTGRSSPEPRCTLLLAGKKEIAWVVTMLEGVDWTQTGTPLAEIRVAPVEIEVTLVDLAAREHAYAFYWEGDAFMGDGRLIQAGLQPFRQGIIDQLVRNNAVGRPAQEAPKGKEKVNAVPPPREDGNLPQENVESIEIVVSPSDASRPQCELTVTDEWWIGNAVIWLQRIDWSQEGTPLSRMQIIKPDIEMSLIEQDGRAHRYQFYWKEDGLIDLASGRFLKADVSGFRQMMVEALIAQCAAMAEAPLIGLHREATYQVKDSPYAVALSPDATLVAIAYPRHREVVLWSPASQKVVARSREIGVVRHLAFGPQGKQLACLVEAEQPPQTARPGWDLVLLDVPELRRDRTIGSVEGSFFIGPLHVSSDGRWMAVVAQSSVLVANVPTGAIETIAAWNYTVPPPPAAPEGGFPHSLAFSPDSSLLAVGADDLTVTLWDLQQGESPRKVATLPTDAPPASLSFAPQGRLLVAGPGLSLSGGDDAPAPHAWAKSLQVWDVTTRQEILLPLQHPAIDMHVAFVPAEMHLAIAGSDRLTLWDLSNWPDQIVRLLDEVETHGRGVHGLRAAAQAQAFLTYGPNDAAVWRLDHSPPGEEPTLDATNDHTLKESLREMMAPLSNAAREELEKCFGYYENPYSDPLFDGQKTDESWSHRSRYEKYRLFHGLTLEQLRAELARVAPRWCKSP